jgi:hypothetical protein
MKGVPDGWGWAFPFGVAHRVGARKRAKGEAIGNRELALPGIDKRHALIAPDREEGR